MLHHTSYNFTFTDHYSHVVLVTGSFTTDGAAAADPGFELITSMTFETFRADSGTVYVGPFTGTLVQGAAYNPTTQDFVNHYRGGNYTDIGSFDLTSPTMLTLRVETSFDSFIENLNAYFINAGFSDGVDGPIVFHSISPAATPPVVPEPTSLLLLGTGLLGAVVSRRRGTR